CQDTAMVKVDRTNITSIQISMRNVAIICSQTGLQFPYGFEIDDGAVQIAAGPSCFSAIEISCSELWIDTQRTVVISDSAGDVAAAETLDALFDVFLCRLGALAQSIGWENQDTQNRNEEEAFHG